MKNCIICGTEIESKPNNRKYCEICRHTIDLVAICSSQKTSKGHELHLIAQRKWNNSFKGRQLRSAYAKTLKGKEIKARQFRQWVINNRPRFYKYNQTLKGQLNLMKRNATRRLLEPTPELYIQRLEQLHRNRESCAICGIIYHHTHQIDHVLALCNGGDKIIDGSNYQPICILCHRIKSAEDRRKCLSIRRLAFED